MKLGAPDVWPASGALCYGFPMTNTDEMTAILQQYRMNYPLGPGGDGIVCQGHVDACARWGHAFYRKDGVEQGFCPRCGELTD